MTFPVWIHIGSWRIHPHLFFELLAYVAAAGAYWLSRKRLGDPIPTEDRWTLAATAVTGAVVGSRLLFWLEDPHRTLQNITSPLYLVGGQTIVGAILGGWLAVEWQKRRLHIAAPTGDLFALPIAVGAAVGRIGCFLSGLPDGTYGTATTLPWGVDLGDGIARHPTALYESLFMAALAVVILRMPATSRRGDRFLLLAAAYFAFRFTIEFIKPGVPVILWLTAIQCAALAGVLVCARLQSTRGKDAQHAA